MRGGDRVQPHESLSGSSSRVGPSVTLEIWGDNIHTYLPGVTYCRRCREVQAKIRSNAFRTSTRGQQTTMYPSPPSSRTPRTVTLSPSIFEVSSGAIQPTSCTGVTLLLRSMQSSWLPHRRKNATYIYNTHTHTHPPSSKPTGGSLTARTACFPVPPQKKNAEFHSNANAHAAESISAAGSISGRGGTTDHARPYRTSTIHMPM